MLEIYWRLSTWTFHLLQLVLILAICNSTSVSLILPDFTGYLWVFLFPPIVTLVQCEQV
jgi:uncharacterized integral membrane protein